MPHLAFYRGGRTFTDRVIQRVTRSNYSHVEFLPEPPVSGDVMTLTVSASGRDGGVRWKKIKFRPDRWDILSVPWAPEGCQAFFSENVGKPYDFWGLIGSQALNLRRQSPNHWFCSEICAAALKMGAPHSYSPGDLHRQIVERNAIYEAGRAA